MQMLSRKVQDMQQIGGACFAKGWAGGREGAGGEGGWAAPTCGFGITKRTTIGAHACRLCKQLVLRCMEDTAMHVLGSVTGTSPASDASRHIAVLLQCRYGSKKGLMLTMPIFCSGSLACYGQAKELKVEM